jgi:3-deoxy-manno-octulosonate cytidylyltransferase (CMP-KDO synthetase)
MVAHVWDRAVEAGADDVLVATDDERIRVAVSGFGGRALMTSPDHASGTDRLAEVAEREGWSGDDIVVNLQGDEPMIRGTLVREMATFLERHPEAGLSTLATPIRGAADLWNPNVVKVVLDQRSFALYFSRAPIPWVRGTYSLDAPPVEVPSDVIVLRHLGLYGYRVRTLLELAKAPQSPLETAESLEQLRALSMGVRIFVGIVAEPPGHGVDTPEDLARVEALLAGK